MLDINQFYIDVRHTDGLYTGCKKCSNKYVYNWRGKNPTYHKNYMKSDKGKLDRRRQNSKRRRKLGYIQFIDNPFPSEIKVDYHHINDLLVIPIPTILHNNLKGNNHRLITKKWVDKIYQLNIDNILKEV